MGKVVSGLQPTGSLHIGNYLGAVHQWLELSEEHDCTFFVVDLHALTARPKPAELTEQTKNITAMLIALGLDPKACTIAVQSGVSAHSELMWLLSNFVTLGQLNRMTQYKEKQDKYGQYVGLYTYPILMAADVLLYKADIVPVGEDQVQHLELAREAIRTLNKHTGLDWPEPKPVLNKFGRIMSLADPNKKMSKSVPGSAIGLLDDEATIARTIKRAVTDSDPNATELSPGLKTLFQLLEAFSSPDAVKHFRQNRTDGKLSYGELKEQLIEDIVDFLRPVQATYHTLINDEKALKTIVNRGNEAANLIAQKNLKIIKNSLGIWPNRT